MPLYEYECTECGHRTELLQSHGDPPLAKCPQCGSPVRKLFSAPAVQFKGTGWYVTDYSSKGKKADVATGAGGDKEASSAGSGGTAAEGKKSDTKSSGTKDTSSGAKE